MVLILISDFLGDESLTSSNRCFVIEWSFETESAFSWVQE